MRRPAACSSDVPAAEPFDFNSTITNDLSSLPALDNVVDSFMRFWTLKGVSLAVTRGDSLLYARGYGKADLTSEMTPGTTMRLASVSKLLTAVGIMRLQEQGKLHLDTPVFGPYGILEE
ncbi:MAG: beta-lactamase family protein, partial [Bacteroidales bacterium]|nr:beta-lactamase family protein [Bacteroidales bacterium]